MNSDFLFQISRSFMLPCVKLRASPLNQSPSHPGHVWLLSGGSMRSSSQCCSWWWRLKLLSDVLVRASSCGRPRQTDARVRANPRVQDEGKLGLGGDGCWHLRDSQLCLFGDFSRDRLLVHHWGEPRHEHERSKLPLGTVEHTRRCETPLIQC